jgi:hypothetical protein
MQRKKNMMQYNLALKRTGKKMIKQFYTIIILIFLFANTLTEVHADEIKITATVDKTRLELGDVIRYKICVHGTFENVRPQLPPLKDFSIRFGPYISIDTEIMEDDTVTVFHRYLYGLAPQKTGNLKIGPATLRYNNKTYKTDSINIEVVDRTPF